MNNLFGVKEGQSSSKLNFGMPAFTLFLFGLKIRMTTLPHDKGILIRKIGPSYFSVFGKVPIVVVDFHQYWFVGRRSILYCCCKFCWFLCCNSWVCPSCNTNQSWISYTVLYMLHSVHFIECFAFLFIFNSSKFWDIYWPV